MTTPAAFDFTPLLSLMLLGLAVALGPLAWVWLRSRRAPVTHRLHLLTLVTLFLTFDLVLFGAFTRLSDSGLGCPDWPGCYGEASPVGAQRQIASAQAALPSGPVTPAKAWIEMIHRYLATGVGVLILTLAVATWAAKRATLGADSLLGGRRATRVTERGPQISLWWSVFTLLWVGLQGAFGALTVTMKLFPAIVTLHLLGGLVLLALLRVQAVFYAEAFEKTQGFVKLRTMTSGGRQFLWWCFGLLWLQIALGGWVSTNYAVLACTEFPQCQGAWWPPMNFSEGFTIWRELGAGSMPGNNIGFAALTAIHYAHRLGAYAVFGVLALLCLLLAFRAPFRREAGWLAGLLLLQLASGLGNVLLGWPLAAALLHTAGAAGLVLVLTGLLASARAHDESPFRRVEASMSRPPTVRQAAAVASAAASTAFDSQPQPDTVAAAQQRAGDKVAPTAEVSQAAAAAPRSTAPAGKPASARAPGAVDSRDPSQDFPDTQVEPSATRPAREPRVTKGPKESGQRIEPTGSLE